MLDLQSTKLDEYFKLPNSGLRDYFSRVAAGSDSVIRATLFKKEDPQSVLARWMPHLDKLSNQWPTLVEFEKDLAKKVGPMSVMAPLESRLTDIESYYDCITKQSKPLPQMAIDATLDEFAGIKGLRLRSQRNTMLAMRKSTNSGNPYFTKRRDVVDDTLPFTLSPDHQTLSHGDKWGLCAVLGWRGQEGGPSAEDVKQRVVWMFPFAVNIAELQVYQPLIEACQRRMLVPAWVSMEAVDRRITALFDTKADEDLVICTDFSKFDQHFNPDMADAAKALLSGILSANRDTKDWLDTVFPIKYNIPLAIGMGKLVVGQHGMGSGSGGTNADETLVHRALQHEAALSAGQTLNLNSMCLGDDGIISYPGCTVEHITEVYSAHGQDMNIDKQYASTSDCTYLRRWHHKDYRMNGVCVGVYSTARALGRLMYQERYYKNWSPKMVALRQLSILENVKFHPLREEFVKFCIEGDRYRLGIDIPGFLDNIEGIAKDAMDKMPDFLGYTKTQQGADVGIKNWWIVQHLKSLA